MGKRNVDTTSDAPFTLSEWEALVETWRKQDNSDGLTRRQLAEQFGHNLDWVSDRVLRPGIASGRIVVGRRVEYRVDGVPQRVPVYRLVAGAAVPDADK